MHECGAAGSDTCHTACPVLCHSESCPLGLSVCECRAAGSANGQTACPVRPTLRQSLSHYSHVPVPVWAPPTGLDECLFFTSLVSDLLALQFSVSSGCVRRHSVSTYTTILVLPVSEVLRLISCCCSVVWVISPPFSCISRSVLG